MSDLTLNRFLGRGTTAERLAFTPNPPTPASGPDHAVLWYDTTDNAIYSWQGGSPGGWELASAGEAGKAGIVFAINDGGDPIATGTKYPAIRVPFNCTIVGWTLVADVPGEIVIDIWKATGIAGYQPTNADSITGASPMAILGSPNLDAQEDTSLGDWDVDLLEGDLLLFHVDSCDLITVCGVNLHLVR